MTLAIPRPDATEYAPYFGTYINQVPEGDVLQLLGTQHRETEELLAGLSEDDAGFRYAEGKWSIREVIGHLSDAERIFCYRALCFARGETQGLPGFDENAYVADGNADRRTLHDLLAEFAAVRAATLALFRSFEPDLLERRGVANNREYTVRSIAYIIAGHERHHVRLFRERYFPAMK